MFVQLSGQAAEKRDWNEDRRKRKRYRDDRSADIGHRLLCGIDSRHVLGIEPMLCGFDNDNRVIDDNADREHQAE